MSSIGRNTNRFNSIRPAIQSLQANYATTQAQVTTSIVDHSNQMKALLTRLECCETSLKTKDSEIMSVKAEIQSIRATMSASASASASAAAQTMAVSTA
jgi:hypothetical protein